jgi:3-dehydroquinate dehydratase type I
MFDRLPLRICVSITAKTTREALVKMEEGFAQADMVELRIDGIQDANLPRLLKHTQGEVLITNRVKEEGGAFTGTEKERVSILSEAVALGADYVDVELRTAPVLIAGLKKKIEGCQGLTKLILSYHNFERTPSPKELRKRLDDGYAAGADIVKIVSRAREMADNLKVLGLIPYAQRKGKEIIAFCMGEKGKMSRVMAPLLGSYLTYASLNKGEVLAPGQMTVKELKKMFGILNGKPVV